MSLFGRRKPGFAKEEELKPGDIPGEFSDAVDPAVKRNDLNPKHREKEEFAGRAQAVMGKESVEEAEKDAEKEAEEGKQDLFDYMESLPDVEDPYPPFAPEPEKQPEPAPTQAQILASYIRERTRAAMLTPLSLLHSEVEEADKLLEEMEKDESCQSVLKIEGEKDMYYYDSGLMTRNYAMIAMLIADKDLERTIAEMVRWNCRTYPSPTPVDYFQRHPYYLTRVQIDLALSHIEKNERFADIKRFVSKKGILFLYSENVMSERYAKSLADFAEDEENA
ncbi:MAG: hypothetical protein Q4G52_09900 [Clostridia bacterium]|nr:hypothetical protein [Clostridia bacterium]